MNNNILETKIKVYEAYDSGSISQDEKRYLLDLLGLIGDHDFDKAYEMIKELKEFSYMGDVILDEASKYLNDSDDIFTERVVTIGLATMNFYVAGNGEKDRDYGDSPYFKIFNGKTLRSSDKVTRISFISAEYVIHNNEKWILNSKERKLLMQYLTTTMKDGETLWNMLIDEAKIVLNNLKDNPKYPKWIELLESCRDNMPDYNKLTLPKKNK